MRKLIILSLLSGIVFCACTTSTNREGYNQSTGSSIISEAASSSVPASGSTIQKQSVRETKIQTVTDRAGIKRKLKLGNVDTENKEILVQQPDSFSGYAQVADGHYYYLRKEKETLYTFYCDRGNKVGSFQIAKGYYFKGCCYYGGQFYVVLYRCDKYSAGSIVKDDYFLLSVADFSQQELKTIRKFDAILDGEIYLYKNKIKVYEYVDGEYLDEKGELIFEEDELSFEYNMEGSDGEGGLLQDEEKVDSDIGIIDGKCYYAKQGKGNEIQIFRKDLSGEKVEEIFCYQSKRKIISDKEVEVYLDIDQEDLFISEWSGKGYMLYTVPRSGGEMQQVTSELMWEDYTYNDKYIFWLDNSYQIHMWNRKTKEEEKTVISPLHDYNREWELNCTAEGLYIQECGFYDGPARTGYNLYYMNLDGEKFEVIWDDANFIREESSGEVYDGYR